MDSSRFLAIALATLLVIGLLVALSSAASDIRQVLLDPRQDRLPPCPDLIIAGYPSEIHFTPGLVEHQSWLEFAVPQRFDGNYALCFDGRQVEAGRRLEYSSRGTGRVSVHTPGRPVLASAHARRVRRPEPVGAAAGVPGE